MKARRSVSASASRAGPDGSVTKCARVMSGSLVSRLRRVAKIAPLFGGDFGLHEHLREGRMRVVGCLRSQHQFGKGRDLDVTVGCAFVVERDATAFAIAFGNDDAFDLGAQRADRS